MFSNRHKQVPIDADRSQSDMAIRNLNSTINQPKIGLNSATIQTPIDADRLQSDKQFNHKSGLNSAIIRQQFGNNSDIDRRRLDKQFNHKSGLNSAIIRQQFRNNSDADRCRSDKQFNHKSA